MADYEHHEPGNRLPDAAARDRALRERLHVQSEPLERLIAELSERYDEGRFGLPEYLSIEDDQIRALASDLLIESLDSVETNLIESGLADKDLTTLIGPSGRTMPGPDTTVDEIEDLARMQQRLFDGFRALGSVLDCLAAAVILMLGLPRKVQRAEGMLLTAQLPALPGAGAEQLCAAAELGDVLSARGDDPPGWLAWALETRNMLHRARRLVIWLNRPGRKPGQPQLLVRTSTPVQYLMRMEPHLNRYPWLTDLHSLEQASSAEELWLPEPAHVTVTSLRERLVALVDEACAALAQAWRADGTLGWIWPTKDWSLDPRQGPRIERARAFGGFDPEYPAPPPHEIRMSRHSARRARLGERLRQRREQ